MADFAPIRAETITPAGARERFEDVLEQVAHGRARFILEKDGRPVAAIISAADLESLNRYEKRRAERFRALEEISRAFEDVAVDELEKEVAKALAAVRAESRKRGPRSVNSA